MPLPPGVLRVTFNTRLGGSEIALYGFHCQVVDPNQVSQGLQQAVADKARDSWLEQMADQKLVWPNSVVWESVRVDRLEAAPGPRYWKVADSHFAEFDASGPGSYAGTNTTSLPWECSAVVSMAAYPPGGFAVNKGRLRGRYYLPPYAPSNVSGVTGELSEQTLTLQMAAIGDFHEQLNDEIGGVYNEQLQLVVASRANDDVARVQYLWMDSKVDSQRRRENRQPATMKETYQLEP